VAHSGVPHKSHIQNIVSGHSPTESTILAIMSLRPFDEPGFHPLKTRIGTFGRVGDPGRDILPIDHLRIHHGFCGMGFSGLQTAKIGSHRGGSDVNGQAPGFFDRSGI